MTELLTAAQMRAIEAAAIASGTVTGLELMERAGRGVVDAVFAEWPELAAGSFRAVVLCGPGNNGGDGFVVARLLKEWGWEVEVFLYGTPEGMPPDARVNYERWVGMGEVRAIHQDDSASKHDGDVNVIWEVDLFVDALFGIGLNRAMPLLWPVEWLMHRAFDDALWHLGKQDRTKIVAIDVPSGLCADSGRELEATRHGGNACYLAVTFHRPKVGHFLADGPKWCTRLRVVDIGLGQTSSLPVFSIDHISLIESFGDPMFVGSGQPDLKSISSHKYTHGHALILSGPPGHGGAARLAARGALRIGAGVVTVGCEADAVAEHAARLDAVMVRVAGDDLDLLADARINAVCVGPGLGVDARAVALVGAVLGATNPVPGLTRNLAQEGGAGGPGSGPGRGVVLDADALTILSQHPDLFAMLHKGCVLTPHAGEFARLFPDIAAKLAAPATTGPAYSKVDACREAASLAGCVVLFKGPDTVIADPDGRCSINSAHYERAAPWLATAGSGDVLAGFIAGLLARGFAPMQAAETAAWLHVECARSFGPGLIAEDLAEELPKVFRALGV
jgi:ADP-dependent NAD(P)H-hydrate dehydratase / NAD(P)H-hydrate epimerase